MIGLLATSALLPACKRSLVKNEQGYIVGGTDDIEAFNPGTSSEQFRESFKSTVLLSTLLITKKRKFCSGSMINTDPDGKPEGLRILTNFHCFASTSESGKVSENFLPEACASTQVFFNVAGSTYTEAIGRKCKVGSLMGDHEGDIAVFELEGEIPEGYGPLKLWPAEDIPTNRKAFLIHHPDIAENFVPVGTTGISLPAASITSEDCKTLGEFSTEEWVLDTTLPYSFKHSCDLVHGSSGSALIDVDSNMILGVNWGGIEIKYKNKNQVVNAATRSSYIQAFLNGDVKRLKEESKREASEASAERAKDAKNQKNYLNKVKACGVIATGSGGYGLLAALLLPLVIVLLGTSRRRPNSPAV